MWEARCKHPLLIDTDGTLGKKLVEGSVKLSLVDSRLR